MNIGWQRHLAASHVSPRPTGRAQVQLRQRTALDHAGTAQERAAGAHRSLSPACYRVHAWHRLALHAWYGTQVLQNTSMPG